MGKNARKRERADAECWVPDADPDYEADPRAWAALWRLVERAESTGVPQNGALIGPSGTGKTTLGYKLAHERDATYGRDGSRRPAFVCNPAGIQSADQLFGDVGFRDGRTVYEPSRFLTGIQTAGATILINDFALMQNRTVQNAYNEVLDPSTRSVDVPGLGRTVRVARGVVFVATWNVGGEYTGNTELAQNILDRFQVIMRLDAPTNRVAAGIIARRSGCKLAMARRIVAYFEALRKADGATDDDGELSMRRMIAAAEQTEQGANIVEALYATVLSRARRDERESMIQALQATSKYLEDQAAWDDASAVDPATLAQGGPDDGA